MDDRGQLKAIETVYNGYRFRSRLEARWAVLLDSLGVKYEYEAQGYDLDGLWYLPDFWLPDMDCWIETKGRPMEREDDTWRKARDLAAISDKYVNVFCGQISTPGSTVGKQFFGAEDDHTGFDPTSVWWFQCPICQAFQLGARITELPCRCIEAYTHPDDNKSVRAAHLRARQARFEHGATP